MITRRYFAVRYPDNEGITIDVRTSDKVSDAQAQANAEELAARKLKSKSLSVTAIDIQSDVKADYSIGPKERHVLKVKSLGPNAHAKCSCGLWEFKIEGCATQDHIEGLFADHVISPARS
jgi:hypothetical protein